MLKQGMHAQHSVVWLDHCGGNLRTRPDSETQLGLLAVVHREALQQQTAQSRTCPSTASVVDHESLKTCAIVGKLTDTVQHEIDDLFADRVVPTGEVVCGVLLSRDELFWVEELTVSSGAHFVNNCWFQIHENSAWNVFSGTRLAEECVEGIIASTDGLVTGHLSIW